ncbi:SGNH/GDSL hydrolase family protein [Anaeromyxobacter oryzisoli]|uniref:SGNH/GDSL hydrolase family protein n=1 Tax=Anaeromyxobacter oryzisoli TaxID=2925408 RepID=UPI001F5758E2|nr:SGNH/GDSL hydrolase family protein [Anaeromyxobacter sp. SG63]
MQPTSIVAARGALLAAVAVALAAPAAAQAQLTYVAVGESTATGVGAQGGGYPPRLARRLEASGVPVRLLNLAAAGATVADVRRDQLPRALGAAPQLLTIGIGLNDLARGRSLRDFSKDLQVMADLLHRTKAVVVISNLPDLSLAPPAAGRAPDVGKRIEQYNAAIETVAARYGFVLADVWGASRAAVRAAGPGGFFAADGLHPSADGYERWADVLAPAAERALAAREQARRGAAAPPKP